MLGARSRIACRWAGVLNRMHDILRPYSGNRWGRTSRRVSQVAEWRGLDSGVVEQTPSPGQAVSSRVFTIPNVLSMFRLLMVPVFLILVIGGSDVLALVVLVVSSATDFLDGLLARRLNQVTRLGQLLDPAADRLFIFATLIGLAVRDIVPWWLAAVIVARDLALVLLGVVLANHGFGPIRVHRLGKIATAALFYALPVLMLGQAFPPLAWLTDPVGWACVLWGAFLYWWAGWRYIGLGRRMLKIPLAEEGAQSDTLGR